MQIVTMENLNKSRIKAVVHLKKHRLTKPYLTICKSKITDIFQEKRKKRKVVTKDLS